MQPGNALNYVQDEAVDPRPLVSTVLVVERVQKFYVLSFESFRNQACGDCKRTKLPPHS